MIPVAELTTAADVIANARRVSARIRAAQTPPPRRREARKISIVVVAPEPKPIKITRPPVDVAMLEAQALIAQIDRPPTLEFVLCFVAREFRISPIEITSERRMKRLIPARRAYCWLAHKTTRRSIVSVGKRCGGRGHSTIMHSLRKVEERRSKSAEYKLMLDSMADAIRAAWAARKDAPRTTTPDDATAAMHALEVI